MADKTRSQSESILNRLKVPRPQSKELTESGIMALKKGQDDEESFALTNTITVATSDEYKISENS